MMKNREKYYRDVENKRNTITGLKSYIFQNSRNAMRKNVECLEKKVGNLWEKVIYFVFYFVYVLLVFLKKKSF